MRVFWILCRDAVTRLELLNHKKNLNLTEIYWLYSKSYRLHTILSSFMTDTLWLNGVNNSQVTYINYQVDNGVMHVVDTVLIPPVIHWWNDIYSCKMFQQNDQFDGQRLFYNWTPSESALLNWTKCDIGLYEWKTVQLNLFLSVLIS